MGITQDELAGRIGMARARANTSQAQLAERVGLTQSAVSRIESGDRGVDSLELAAIADALEVSVLDLLETEPLAAELRLAARVESSAEPATVDRALSRVVDMVRLDRLLDDLEEPRMPNAEPKLMALPKGTPSIQGQRLAERARAAWTFGDDPLPRNLYSLIEDWSGLAVALEPLGEHIAGLCARVDEHAIALADSSAIVGRQRFTVAHELCHLLVGDGDRLVIDEQLFGRQSHAETRANSFAAYFLMPARAIRRYIRNREVDDEVAVGLQYTFGVSLDALLWHLVNLDLISSYRRQQIHEIGARALAARHGYSAEWANLEADRGARRPPRRLYQRAVSAYANGKIGIEPLADLLGRHDLSAFRQELEDHGVYHDHRWWEDRSRSLVNVNGP